MSKMTERTALTIAYNILNDELERAKDELDYSESYYNEIKDAIEKIKEMNTRANIPQKKHYDYQIYCKRCLTTFKCNESDFHEEIMGHGFVDHVTRCPKCNSVCSRLLEPDFCTIKTL